MHRYFGFKDSLKNQQVTILPFHDHAYFSDYTSEHNINVDNTLEKRPSNHIFVTNNIQNEDLGSNSGTSTSLPRSIDINLARDRNGTSGRNGGGGGPGSGCHYTAGPLIPCDPPSPVHSRRSTRSYREVEERPGGTMQRAASTADISQYECSEDGAIRLHMVSNMILLIASLLMIGTGNYIPYFLIQFPRKLLFFDFGLMYCDLCSQYINVRKLFKGGNYSRAETI